MNNKQEYGAVIGLITVIATQVLLKLIGVNKISTWIYATVLILSGVIFSIYAIRSKNNKMGFKLTIASVVIMLFSKALSLIIFGGVVLLIILVVLKKSGVIPQ
ncbi:hypothetical protein [Clostridium sp. BSD9I1]|uniref:hypothetical protein n=1 Tax=Clostridium sp. BSD9I1 TaxID=2003589 RepID=UPI001648A551|nr:hypothetical protein [Clostridium sp. BSD9I1]